MRKILIFISLSFTLGFSQANPVASDVKTAHFKDINGLIHLVGSDTQGGTLTYTVISLPSHGTLKDGSTIVTAGMDLSGDTVTFSPYSDETGELNHQYIFSGTNSFKYKITDSDGNQSNEGTVNVRVFDSYLNPPTSIGAEIDGKTAGENFGHSVALNEDGMIMAVGAPMINGDGTGLVRVYKYSGTSWDQLGVDAQLQGSAGDKFGTSVSLSGDGTVLAVGLPYNSTASANAGQVKIFKFSSDSWELIKTITPTNSPENNDNKSISVQFGNDVRLSRDGKTLAISDIWFTGKNGSKVGRALVYRNSESSSDWSPIGGVLNLQGDSANDNLSWGISLSANGNILATGAHEYDVSGSDNKGQVTIYQYNSSTTSWDVKGTLLGESSGEKLGSAIDLNGSGLVIATGSTKDNPDSLTAQGSVNVYSWDGTNYVSLGNEIKGEQKFDYFGAQLSLDNEGNTLSVMAPGHDNNSSAARTRGHVKVYNYDLSSTSWVQSPDSFEIEGENEDDQSANQNKESKGQRVFLSGDGSVLAIGADQNDGIDATDSKKGNVRVFELFETQIIPESTSQTVAFDLFEQVTSSEDIVLEGTDPTGDGDGDSSLVYVITELNTAKLFEGDTEITSADIPHTLIANKVKYNSNSDVVVNDSFKFIVHDGKASSVADTVTLNVIPDNDAPVSIINTVTTDEGVSKSVTLTATDVDSPQEDLIFIIESVPSKGALKEGETVIEAGSVLIGKDITYTTTNSNYSGTDSFTFKVKDKGIDGGGVTDIETSESAAISITVNNTDNDQPIAYPNTTSLEKKTAATIKLTGIDWETTDLTYIISELPSLGTLSNDDVVIAVGDLPKTLSANQVVYTGTSDDPSSDSFKFRTKDSGMEDGSDKKESEQALVTINFSATDNPPVAVSVNLKAVQNISQEITLNASDPDGDLLKFKVLTLPSNGGTLKDGVDVLTTGDLPRVLSSKNLSYTSNTIGDDSFSFLATACSVTNPNNTSELVVTGDLNEKVSKAYPMVTSALRISGSGSDTEVFTADVNIKLTLGAENVFESCEIKLDIIDFDDGLQFEIAGTKLLDFQQKHWDSAKGANTTEFQGGGRFVTSGSMWQPWNGDGNPKLEISNGKIKLMVDTRNATREDALPFMDSTKADWTLATSFTYDCIAGFNLIIGNQNGGGGPSEINADLTVEAFVGPCADSNEALVNIKTAAPNDPPVADPQTLETKVNDPLAITLTASDPENDPLTYVIETLPTNGQLSENGKIILQSELPRVISAADISFVSSVGGQDSFTFLVKANSLATFAKDNSLRFIENNGAPVTYVKPAGKTYFLIQNETGQAGFEPVDWADARTITNSIDGAKMYIILNEDMEKMVWDGLKSMGLLGSNRYWLGLKQDRTAADYDEPGNAAQNYAGWYWVDGTHLKDGYSNWAPGEPNNAGGEDFGQLNFGGNGIKWNDMRPGNAQSWPLFEFSINDESDSNTATITINVKNDVPIADSQTVFFNEGSIDNAITLTGSDSKSRPLIYSLETIPEKGTLKVGGVAVTSLDVPLDVLPSNLTYDPPNANYFGEQSFKFKVNNGLNDSSLATVTITIINVNDPPESDPGNYTTKEDVPIDIIHVGRDIDLINEFSIHTQMGKDLPQPIEQLGESLALSANGKRLILGAYSTGAFARVYDWNGTDWEQLGETLNGETNGDWFGEYVSISNDGNRIAVAGSLNDNANGTDAGHIKVFDWNGTSWDIVGSPILGNNAGDTLGYRGVHLSGDGRTLATISFSGGYVVTYAWDGSAWNKIGALIDIVKSPGNPGSPGQVYLSTDGKRLAVGSVADGSKGNVRVFDWDGSSWIQFASIDGKSGNFGCAIDLSRDGKKLIVGEKNTSLTSVYDISGASPVQIGADINYSGNQSSVFWRYVSISDDGNRVGIPVMSSKLGVFDWDGTLWNQLGKDVTGGFGESFDMSSDAKIMAAGIHSGPNKVFNILNLEYIITTLPSNGTLKEGAKTLVAADLPYTLTTSDQKLTYTPNNNFFGTDSYLFKLNDGKADSTNSLNGNREDSKVTITIEEFILTLPSNYTITTTDSCEGSDVGILDIEVLATTFRKTGTTVDIPITYNVAIVGKGNVGTIVSPNKTLQVKDLAKGTYELKFTVVGEPKYVHPKIEFTVGEVKAPAVHNVGTIEVCDDAKDGDDLNGKAEFETSTIINRMLTDPNTGVVQDASLLDIEFTYFDETSKASVSAATLPNPFYSASQTVTVKLTSKANTSCIGVGSVVFAVNTLPVFERSEDTKFVCLNLDAVTIGVKSSDSRTYSYTWTRNGAAFNLNIPGFDSSILIGLGGDYEVTATTTDGTNCSQILKFNIGESNIATVVKKDITIADLNPGPDNTITVLTTTLGIGDYEFAIDDISGPYQDEPTFENVRPGLHTIYIRDKNGCGIVNIESIVIGYKKFFTPNGDGINDTWNIIGLSKASLPNSKIYIFDRFGKLLKELDPLGAGWDGTFIGKPMPSTDYWFRVVLEDGREFKSHFSLVRSW